MRRVYDINNPNDQRELIDDILGQINNGYIDLSAGSGDPAEEAAVELLQMILIDHLADIESRKG